MGITYASPNIANYTLGAHEILIGAQSLGNLVSAKVSIEAQQVSHFSALYGEDIEDALAAKRISINIDATLDEPNAANLKLFFLADSNFYVGMNTAPVSNITFKGIAIAGNEFTWTIHKGLILPSGELSYNAQDWTTFGLKIKVLHDAANPTHPYGTITHSGVV